MLAQTEKDKPKRIPKVPGVRQAARDLGVTAGYLHGVITGYHRRIRLKARYYEWLKANRPDDYSRMTQN